MRAPRRASERDLLPGGHGAEVVGESFNQEALSRLAGGKTEMSATVPVVACLVREPANPYDPNAIRVEVNGVLVGHLARDYALLYQPVLARLAELGRPAKCRATIVGGWKNRRGEGHFGIELDIAAADDLLRELG